MLPKISAHPLKTQLDLKRVLSFYFSDGYLKHLYKAVQLDDLSLEEGWIPLAKLLSLKKIRAISKNINLLSGAIQSCQRLELDASGTQVRRKKVNPKLLQSFADTYLIYASGIPSGFALSDAKRYFEQFGPVTEIKHCKEAANSLWIRFEKEQSSNLVLCQSHFYNGKPFDVTFKKCPTKPNKSTQPSFPAASTSRPTFDYQPGCLLSITNLPPTVTSSDLREFFSAYGALVAVTRPSATAAILHYALPLAHDVLALIFPTHRLVATDPAYVARFKEARLAVIAGADECAYHADRAKSRPHAARVARCKRRKKQQMRSLPKRGREKAKKRLCKERQALRGRRAGAGKLKQTTPGRSAMQQKKGSAPAPTSAPTALSDVQRSQTDRLCPLVEAMACV